MCDHICGILPHMTTPFRSNGTIDDDARRAETCYMIDVAKVHGLAICGSTGEGHTLTTDETRFAPTVPLNHIQAFVGRYQAKFSMLPEIWAAAYCDTTDVAAKVTAAAASADSEKMRQAFFALKYSGLLADFRHAPNGDGNHQIHIIENTKTGPKRVTTVKF